MLKVVSIAIGAHTEKRKRETTGLMTESNNAVTKPYLPVKWLPIIPTKPERLRKTNYIGKNNSK